MDKFNLTNKWEDINAFLAFTEFGLTRIDVPIDSYIERIIKNMNSSMKCARILLLRNLVSLGYYGHPWVQEQIPLVFSSIRQDGTVRCLDKTKKTNDSKLPDMGCYRQITAYLLLGAEMKKIGVVLPQFALLIHFYINHYVVFRSDTPEKVIEPAAPPGKEEKGREYRLAMCCKGSWNAGSWIFMLNRFL